MCFSHIPIRLLYIRHVLFYLKILVSFCYNIDKLLWYYMYIYRLQTLFQFSQFILPYNLRRNISQYCSSYFRCIGCSLSCGRLLLQHYISFCVKDTWISNHDSSEQNLLILYEVGFLKKHLFDNNLKTNSNKFHFSICTLDAVYD